MATMQNDMQIGYVFGIGHGAGSVGIVFQGKNGKATARVVLIPGVNSVTEACELLPLKYSGAFIAAGKMMGAYGRKLLDEVSFIEML